MAEIATQITYDLDGGSYWPIPFPFAKAADVGAAWIKEGLEKELSLNADYYIIGSAVIFDEEEGKLKIWLKTDLDSAIAAATAAAAKELAGSASIEAVDTDNSDNTDNTDNTDTSAAPTYDDTADIEELERTAELVKEQFRLQIMQVCNDALDQFVDSLDKARDDCIAAIQQAGKDTAKEIAAQLKVVGTSVPQEATLLQTTDLAVGDNIVLPDDVYYLKGGNNLFVCKDGLILSAGTDYKEVGTDGQAANVIQLLKSSAAGGLWRFWVSPITTNQAAADSASAAYNYERSAASYAAEASASSDAEAQSVEEVQAELEKALSTMTANAEATQEDLDDAVAAASESATTARGWAEASQKSADVSYSYSEKAAQAATLAAHESQRPGICVVKTLEEIENGSPGLYLINPDITQSPSKYMGVYAAESTDDMNFDAVFYLLNASDIPAMPGVVQPLPDASAGSGTSGQNSQSGGNWLPCGHTH